MKKYLTIAETAQKLGVSEKAIRARVARRQIPFRRFGSRIMFSEMEIDEFLSALSGCDVAEAIAAAEGRCSNADYDDGQLSANY